MREREREKIREEEEVRDRLKGKVGGDGSMCVGVIYFCEGADGG